MPPERQDVISKIERDLAVLDEIVPPGVHPMSWWAAVLRAGTDGRRETAIVSAEAEVLARLTYRLRDALALLAVSSHAARSPQDDYTAEELACRGCFGPCGRCHEAK